MFIIGIIFLIIFFFKIGYFYGKNSFHKKYTLQKEKKEYLFHELKTFKSYSQYLEDLILFIIFYDIKKGFYIDVGANDPNRISVTKALYIRGWQGINIEPLPKAYQKLIKHRNRDINLNIGAGKKEGYSLLLKKGTLSKIVNKVLPKNNKNLFINITISTLKTICKKYIPKNQEINFCKIDVEGGEKDVLLGYDFDNYRPKVFCIESTKPRTYIPSYKQWEYILLKNDYSFAYQYKMNRFYIDNRFPYLKERFFEVNKIIYKFKHK